MLEIWRTVIYKGEIYEGLYKVSNLGKILSLNYRNTGRAELLTPFEDGHGYLHVVLSKNGKPKTCKVHRLVAELFLPNPDNLPEVNHKDEDKTNNSVENLEWILHKDNCNHGTRNERIAKKQTNDPNKSKKVLQLSLSGELIREWESTHECGRNGYNEGHVAACCRGEEKSHKGFRWKYK